ncbi:MAG TPA: hypothetical protein GXX46_12495 [Peptococcaceae bacterium]|nr:hypothetical protein [Peptococcaceae bacterium]
MLGILSIDFDYFIDASSKERDLYFPNGSEDIPKSKYKLLWEEKYSNYPKLKKIGVIKDYYFLKNFLMSLNINKVYFYKADNHKSIREIIDMIPSNLQLKIVNIDFHHDYYHYYSGGDKYNCGNWLRRVLEERPNTKVIWIRRNDSQLNSLEGMFPFENTTDIKSILYEKFDYVFICRSPEWSPPHLNNKFEELTCWLLRGKTA